MVAQLETTSFRGVGKYTRCYSDIKIYAKQVKTLGGEGIPTAMLCVRTTSMLIAASFLY